jgi:hypothetical protein
VSDVTEGDLLIRVRAYEAAHEDPLPTKADLLVQLEEHVEYLEQEFPDGRPSETWARLRCASCQLKISSVHRALEFGEYAPETRPSFALISGGRDA